ncbi:hypothetical protein PF005_g6084 [Phytophthora fragariae]|uniref:ADP-ribosylation/Crystallin J1 n=2 Tax=Phytophthora fragariae TaxID=53985 RepID=A0A6A3YS32_9STRA|nr:hypothetical protein PF009_g6820 [Phytophthora fragariae]KAE9026263.1 hypothetical protein PF011_g2649 [Phytophthora fragariae]KAE9150107.1 hypothetical protein PF006_g5484 [Phytophthora fragariae]KAE9224004.1 hypothetical protein PF005_g6084 [Phytophthora fragariae]KAE9320242.1 hypothetical protein PF001_g5508 [Phytophthora fragariae]
MGISSNGRLRRGLHLLIASSLLLALLASFWPDPLTSKSDALDAHLTEATLHSSTSAMSLTTKQRALAAVTGPEFYEPPSCPFYSHESGALSPYGAEISPLLKDVAERGEFVPEEFAMTSYRAAKADKGYLNGALKEMVAKGDAGKKYPELASPSKDLHGGIKAPILVARYFEDTPLLLQKTREAVRVHEVGEVSENAAVATALLIQQVVQGVSLTDAISALTSNEAIGADTRASIQQVIDAVKAKSFPDATAAVAHFGKACPLPGVLQGSVFVLLTSGGYVEALRANMLAGGDSCSRAIVIGAVTAAAQGGDAVPAGWKEKTEDYAQIQSLAEKIIQ